MNSRASKRPAGSHAIAAASLFAGMISLMIYQAADATEKFAAQTGVPCAKCHQYPTGDARLTPFGEAFVANGFRLPAAGPKPPTEGSRQPPSGTTPQKQ